MTGKERREIRYQRRKAAREAKKKEKYSLYDDYARIIDPNNLYQAFKKSKRGVGWKESTQRYEMNWLLNIAETRRKLAAGENVQHGFVEFDVRERGKIRHIKSVHISERVVQKTLCDQVLVPILSHPLIYDNGASLKDKGLHFALRRVIAHLSKYYRQNGRSNRGYVLTIDFKKYFDTINHDILLDHVKRYIRDKMVLALLTDFIKVFGDTVSLGLGSQVSQICAVFNPNPLDHDIKGKRRVKYYGRYMDDLYLIHHDRAYLKYCLDEIRKICEGLGITINLKKTRITKLSDGFVFLKGKYILLENGKVIRKPDKAAGKRERRKLKKFKGLLEREKIHYSDIRTAYQSWRNNFMKRFDAYHTVRRIDLLYNRLFIA
ncbi:MAG: RNA-directed DNA polymerase [Treponema sp.]|nr:RNA-directed DNA polymerase [Treponema sp.]